MNNAEYKRLGDYIREVDVRNRDLAVTRLLGVSISKEFIPSIANTIGTDMTSYKIVTQDQFAYGPVTSRNGDKVSIALLEDDVPAIISQAYTVFEISDKNRLLPEYLMMWFRRPEFDRYARYHSHGSAREVFDWDEMCDVRLPIPPLSRQREIVAEYETLTRRIRLNERLIASLESLAQTLYRRTFVDDIDPAHLPPGWRTGTLGEIASVTSGKTLTEKKEVADFIYKYPVAGASGIIGYAREANLFSRFLTTGRVGTIGIVNKYDEPCWAADNVLVVKSDFYEYIYQYLKAFRYEEIMKGGVQSLITQGNLTEQEILIPELSMLEMFEKKVHAISHLIKIKKLENSKLGDILALFLVRLGKYF